MPESPPVVSARTPELPAAAEAVLTFLESVGHRSEAELYLRLFRTLPKPSFAVIVAEAALVRHAIGALTEQVRFLTQLGLVAPVVIGAFDPSGAAHGAERLMKRLPSVGIEPVLFDASLPGLDDRVRDVLSEERIPIVRFSPEPDGEARARFARVGALAQRLASRKVVLLRRRGGLAVRASGAASPHWSAKVGPRGILSLVNLRSERDELLAQRVLGKDEQLVLQHVQEILAQGPQGLVVNVTSPFDLLKELFTVRGAGTLVKSGAELECRRGWGDLDLTRVAALLETSFGRVLRPGFFEREPLLVVAEREYRGAVIVHQGRVAPYLTKFAVEPVAQGEGMGQDLFAALAREEPAFFWRARANNPIAGWYAKLCDGLVRTPRWHVFWRGVPTAAVPELVSEALEQPEDFS